MRESFGFLREDTLVFCNKTSWSPLKMKSLSEDTNSCSDLYKEIYSVSYYYRTFTRRSVESGGIPWYRLYFEGILYFKRLGFIQRNIFGLLLLLLLDPLQEGQLSCVKLPCIACILKASYFEDLQFFLWIEVSLLNVLGTSFAHSLPVHFHEWKTIYFLK